MGKLQMCRICLAEDVRMYVVVNKDLRELYEKLTDIPFVTADRRPILACFFCCAKLKQCCRLMRKCLEANELFAQILDEDYEPNPLINTEHFEVFGGFTTCPIEYISIVEKCQTESIAIKEELPADCHELEDITEPQEDSLSNDLKLENIDNSCLDLADIPPHHSESDSEVDVPLIDKTAGEEALEVSKKKRRSVETNNLKQENIDNSCLDLADIPPHHTESDSEVDVPLVDKTAGEEALEVSKKKRRSVETNSARVIRRTKLEDTITAELKKNEPSNFTVFLATRNRTSKPGTSYKEPDECDQRSLNEVKELKERAQTRIIKKRHKCYVCQRDFGKKSHLTAHIRIHTGEKRYKCDVCQQRFIRKIDLTYHIQVHTGVKPYKCDVCKHSFSRKFHLSRHIRIHTGEKTYKCDVCQRSFTRNSHLIRHHIRKHPGVKVKTYKCDVCQRSFSGKGQLTTHIRTHTGVKHYNCDVCKHSFSRKFILSRHIRIHTGEKAYKCDVCQRSFTRNSNLIRHSIHKHPGVKVKT